MTEWIHLFLDVPRDAWPEATRFWAAATGWELSLARGEDGQFLTLLPPSGPAWVKLQAVEGPPRVHVDLDSRDRPAAVRRSLELGATPAWTYHDVEVHRSPGGLLLCHTLLDTDAHPDPQLRRDETAMILDQVCLDIPPHLWEVEVAFWQALTGRELTPGLRPEYAFLGAEGAARILLQRLDSDDDAIGAHPDFAVADRAAETERHAGLGARVEATFDRWTVLTAPGGQAYCLTDRSPATGRIVTRS